MVKIRYLDGRRFRRAVLAGIEWLQSRREQLNSINVYPVPDADTGTNMSLTMASAAEGLRRSRERSIHLASRGLAERAIMGSQGNSGAILAQFFQGLSDGLQGKLRITTRDFASAVERAKQAAYSALSKPREGTILTVIKDWCEAIVARKESCDDFVELLREALSVARISVEHTPDQLAVLKEHGVVDAGALGFLNLLEGITEYVETGNLHSLDFEHDRAEPEHFAFTHPPMDITRRYCTECMVEAAGVPRADVEEALAPLGDSIVIVSGERLMKVHIHTDEPEAVFEAMAAFGPILKRKRDDMQAQHDEAVEGPASVAIVVDSSCDLPEAYLRANRIEMVPLKVNFGDQVFVDRVELSSQGFFDRCRLSSHHPKTSQPTVGDYLLAFEKASSKGKDILVVSLSGALSGTLNAAKTAAAQFKGAAVHVVDSGSVSVGEALLVAQAREMALAGTPPEAIVLRLEALRRHLTFYIALRSLDFVHRGGRVSFGASLVAKVFNLKPVISFDPDGKVGKAGIAFGARGVQARVIEFARRDWSRFDRFRVAVAHAAAPELALSYKRRIEEMTGLTDIPVMEVSAVLAAHAGPGAAGIAVLGLD